ncbi:putative membrane protein [Metabacillus crassostreae]|uniref:YibE/F family protein n=1 Tax=Metabacillus crassostreae TaxID=929098 RepID=UPI00195AC1ED|nr:YibE/F family protein [Metabacillus crassostreae]MBM7603149.1 putative membrane protein [Metabacillus crassostreae]
MNVLIVLGTILFILMVAIGGKKGARSFIGLFLNFIVLFLTTLFMTDPNADPIILTIIASAFISCINLFYINGVNDKTKTAFLSTILTLSILLLLITLVTKYTMTQGFGEEETGEFGAFSLYIGVDFVKIGASMIIMSTIGAIIDVAISISSPMREMLIHNPLMDRRALFKSGITIGRDILGTNTNTLFFAFFGSYLGLLIWFKDLSYSFGEVINSKVFSAELITILCAGIGVALVIPIASWITAYFFVKARDKNKMI